MIWYFVPSSLTNIPGDAGWPAYGQIVYFSFVTLTSTGFGDIVPVHPVIRMLVNVEAIIGQLYRQLCSPASSPWNFEGSAGAPEKTPTHPKLRRIKRIKRVGTVIGANAEITCTGPRYCARRG